jgi:type IV pilus assembly protein PilC
MAQYTYEGVNRKGEKAQGTLEAGNEGDLRMFLRQQGIRPTKIKKLNAAGSGAGFLTGSLSVPTATVVVFVRQLQLLVSSGMPVVQGLDMLAEYTDQPIMRRVIGELRDKISQGSFMWEALQDYPKIFPKIFVALMRAGEASGSLDEMLKRLAKYLEASERLKRMVRSAMIYPIFVVTIGIIVVFVMLAYVIPKFEEMLSGNGQELPALTQVVIELSHFIVQNFWYILGTISIGVALLIRYLRTPEGSAARDVLVFNLPLFGTLAQKGAVARFTRTMQTLLVAGVNLLDALDICRLTVDNAVVEGGIARIRPEIEAGKTLGMVLSQIKAFPPMSVQMITVGESTGNLDKMLEKVADFYESEVEEMVGGLSKLIEPFVIAILGGLIGTMLVAMYLPIFKMAGGA